MSKTFPAFLITFLIVGAPVESSAVERACMISGRGSANPSLCACIGNAARQTLSFGEQRRAARLFRDPDEAEEYPHVRQQPGRGVLGSLPRLRADCRTDVRLRR